MKKINNFFKNKKILVTGGTGLIGIQLVNELLKLKARVTVVSLDRKNILPKKIKFIRKDLRKLNNCLLVTKNIDYVFHLAGIKGSPEVAKNRPYEFMIPMLLFNTNMIEASRVNNVKKFLFTSSIGVYCPAKKLNEEDVWKTFPSKNDWYAGWTKRVGELATQALETKKVDTYIVRPANVFGPYDNFNKKNAMVIPSLISKFLDKNNKIVEIMGDGSNIRDFIYSKDVARAMIHIMYKNIKKPINLGSGKAVNIKKIVKIIDKITNNTKKISWNKNVPTGDKIRLMNIKLLKKTKFNFKYSLYAAVKETVDWFKKNQDQTNKKYNAFDEKN